MLQQHRSSYYDDQLGTARVAAATVDAPDAKASPSAPGRARSAVLVFLAAAWAIAVAVAVVVAPRSLRPGNSKGNAKGNSRSGVREATAKAANGGGLPSGVPESPHGFPSDGPWHASCHMSVVLPDTACPDALAAALEVIEANVDTGTEFKGTMSVFDRGSDWIWSSRLTYDRRYTDDQLFGFAGAPGDPSSCFLAMRSRSRSRSVLDYGVNYCNMWNVVSRLPGFEGAGAPLVSECYSRNVPSDPVATCARY